MQSTAPKYSTPILRVQSGLMSLANILTIGVVLIIAMPAYAGNTGDEDTEQAAPAGPQAQARTGKRPIEIVHTKAGKKSVGIVDLYGEGKLLIALPSHLGQKREATISEALNSLIPTPTELKSQTMKKIGNTIIIASIAPTRLARRPMLTSPRSTASRLIRSRNIIAMNWIPQRRP